MTLRKIHSFSIVFLILWIASACDTSNSVDPVFKNYFIKYYGEDGDQEARDFVLNGDGTILILGTSIKNQSRRMYLVKVDAEGKQLWGKTFGSLTNEFPQDIEPILSGPDAGNFVVLSNVSRNADAFDIRLTVINTNGDSLKSTVFNLLESQEGKSVTPLSDGGYYVAGKTTDTAEDSVLPPLNVDLSGSSANTADILLIRLKDDFSFSLDNVSRIGASYTGSAVKVFQDGNQFHYAGDSDELTGYNLGDNGIVEPNFFFRSFTDDPGSVPSLYAGSLTLHERMSAIAFSPSGLFMAVGTQTDALGANRRLFATVLNSNFSTIQQSGNINDGGPQREAVAIASSGAGGTNFLLLANEFNAALNSDIYLRKLNVLFESEFEVKFGSTNNNDTGSAVAELPNGDILILGTMQITNQRKIALIKLRSNGQF